MKVGVTGLNPKTPENILFGAGTIHKGLKYDSVGSKWNFDESCVGATSGGSKLSIKPKLKTIEVDGASIKVKELEVKIGEEATMEVNFLEITKDIIKTAALASDGKSEDTKYDLLQSKANIEVGDYWENIAFVGKLLKTEEPVIAILENALCTSGFESEGKKEDATIGKMTFECHADLNGDLETLPWKIYYPKRPVAV